MDGNERKRTESEARMLWNEIKKFWQYRSLIVILILALLLNLGVFVYSQRGNRLLRSEWGHVVELTQAFSDVEEAQAYLAEKQDQLIQATMAPQTDTADFEELEKEWNRQGTILYWFRDRLQYVSSYEKFLNQMEAQAAKSSQISIFKQDPFTVNRAQKTWEAFEKLKGTQLELLVSEGFSGLFDYQAADYIVVVSLLLLSTSILLSDSDQRKMIRSCKCGRYRLSAVKLVSALFYGTCYTIITYVSLILLAFYLYGTDGWSAPVQSIEAFRNCSLSLTCGQFLVLAYIGKLIAALFVILFFSAVTTVAGSMTGGYVFSILLYMISVWRYQKLPVLASTVWLKKVNLAAVFDCSAWFGHYEVLALGEKAIPLAPIIIIYWVVGSIGCWFLAWIAGAKNQGKRQLRKLRVAGVDRLWNRFVEHVLVGHTSVFFHTCYQFAVTFRGVLLYIAAVICTFVCLQNLEAPIQDEQTVTYQSYLMTVGGSWSEETDQFVQEEGERLSDMKEVPWSKREAFRQITDQNERARSLYERGNAVETVGIVDENMVESVFHNSNEKVIYAVICLLFQCIGISFIVSGDAPMRVVLRTCKKGRGVLYRRKCLLSLGYSLILYLTVFLCYLTRKWVLWNPSALQLLIQNASIYEWASIKISFAQAMMIDVCYIAVGMITVTAVLLFLFTRISKKGLGFGVGFSVTVLPMAVALFQPEISRVTFDHCFLYVQELSSASISGESAYVVACLGIAMVSFVCAERVFCTGHVVGQNRKEAKIRNDKKE